MRGCFAFESVFYYPDASRPSRVSVARPFDHVSASGAYGHPELATADKGEALIDVAVAEVVACVREIAAWSPLEPR